MRKTTVGNTTLLILSVIFIYAIMKKPDIAIGYMRSGLKLCAERVIPSLFPFAVLSSLFVDIGGAELAGRCVGGFVSKLLGISRQSAFVPVVGMLCGFPVGAITAVKLYKRGSIGVLELQRLLIISGIPGSAFLISAVGISIWSSRPFGVALYFIQIIATVTIGVALRFLSPLKLSETAEKPKDRQVGGIALFCDSVGDCALSMLKVCGFVLFFVSAVGTLCSVLEDIGVPPLLKIPVLGFFEMTGAVALAPKLGIWGPVWTALFVGWSGMSVHFQILSVCRGVPISHRLYFAAKAVQGVLSALLAYLYIRFFGFESSLPSAPVAAASSTAVVFFVSAFAIALLLPFLRKKFL